MNMVSWQWYVLDLRARGLTRVFMAFKASHDFMGIPITVKKAKMFYEGAIRPLESARIT